MAQPYGDEFHSGDRITSLIQSAGCRFFIYRSTCQTSIELKGVDLVEKSDSQTVTQADNLCDAIAPATTIHPAGLYFNA